MMNSFKIVYAAVVLALFASCAREVSENNDAYEQRYIEAYVSEHKDQYPNARRSETGLYFLSETPGTGTVAAADSLIYARYTSRSLSGDISDSSSDSIAKLLGKHANTTYYGPRLFNLGKDITMQALSEAFQTMRVGGKVRILVPTWLATTGSDARLHSAPMIYDLELLRVISDMTAFQLDSLQHYRDKYYPAADTIHTGLYFADLLTPAATGDLPAEGDTVKVRYVGSLLDGFMFDTNIKDTAKAHHGKDFNKSATFDTLTVIIKDDVAAMDVVQGFSFALKKMHKGDEAVTFFSSNYGYEYQTSGQIQPYSMLRFYIQVADIRKKAEAE